MVPGPKEHDLVSPQERYRPEELTAKLRGADVLFWRPCQDRSGVCRHIADG